VISALPIETFNVVFLFFIYPKIAQKMLPK
jgi:hypothetical protein